MSAVVPLIIESTDSLNRFGPENASELYRKAPATVYYSIGGTGYSATITAGVAAILWTSGFGNNANAPTTLLPIDLPGSFTPFVTFLCHNLGTGTFVAGQMYVAKLSDWSTLAGNNTRTLVVLDLYRFHQAEYAGREMLANLQVIQAGKQTGASAVSIPGSADTGTLSVTFAQPFNAVPVVVASSQDTDRPVAVSGESTTGFTLTASQALWRNKSAGASQYVVTIPAGQASVTSANIGYPSSFSYASVDHVSCASRDPNYLALVTTITASYFVITVWSIPLSLQSSGVPSTPNTLDPVAGANTGNASISNTGNQDRDHTHISAAAGTNTTIQNQGHLHDVTHTHPTGSHQHPMNAHTHGVQIAQPVAGSTPVAVDYEVFGGRGTAIQTVDVSWIAVGS